MKKCRICKHKKLKRIFSLGSQPYANNLLDKPSKSKAYPLDLYQCQHCTLIQLGLVAPKEELFDEYFYVPSASKTQLSHFKTMAQELVWRLGLNKDDRIVDIGSSDGSLLACFKDLGMDVLGIEPAKNVAKLATKNGIKTVCSYFKKGLSNKKAKLALATNVFAHINDLDEFLEALDDLLDVDGVFVAQFPDVRNLLRENQFDTIYHEHMSYFTYEPLHHLFANTKFELYDIESNPIHGGSMRIFVRRRPPLLENFIKNVELIKRDLNAYLTECKDEGKRIVGFGAAAKGTVLLNYCNLDFIDYVVDGNKLKQGKYIPGVNIPIYPEDQVWKDNPEVILILAWNFKNEIMGKLKDLDCTFVVPVPKVEVI